MAGHSTFREVKPGQATAKQRISYAARLVQLEGLGDKREKRIELLRMVGEVLDDTEKEAIILRGLELACRLTGAADMNAEVAMPTPADLSRFERQRTEKREQESH